MTLQELIYYKRQFGKRMPGYLAKPSRAEEAKQLNAAMWWIGRYVHLNSPAIPFYPAAGRQFYGLRDDTYFGRLITVPHRLYLGGIPVGDVKGRNRVMAMAELDDYDAWRGRSPGIPYAAAATGNAELMLECPPTAAAVARGTNEVFAEYLPGAISADGIYFPHGFPVSYGGTDESGGMDEGTPATVEALYTPYTGTLTAAAGCLDSGGTALGISLTYPLIDNELIAVVREAGLSLPSGAVVQWVRVKSFRARSTAGVAAHIYWGADVTGTLSSPPAQSVEVPAGGSYAEFGPLPQITALNSADVTSDNFGLQVFLGSPGSAPTGGPTPIGSLQIEIDEIILEVGYIVAGSGGGGSMTWASAKNFTPDLPAELHETIAHIACVLAVSPGLKDNEILTNLQSVDRRARENLQQMRRANESMLAGLQKPSGPTAMDYYRVGR